MQRNQSGATASLPLIHLKELLPQDFANWVYPQDFANWYMST